MTYIILTPFYLLAWLSWFCHLSSPVSITLSYQMTWECGITFFMPWQRYCTKSLSVDTFSTGWNKYIVLFSIFMNSSYYYHFIFSFNIRLILWLKSDVYCLLRCDVLSSKQHTVSTIPYIIVYASLMHLSMWITYKIMCVMYIVYAVNLHLIYDH